MNLNDFIQKKKIQQQNKKLLLDIALMINKELLEENKITYQMSQYAEQNILKERKQLLF